MKKIFLKKNDEKLILLRRVYLVFNITIKYESMNTLNIDARQVSGLALKIEALKKQVISLHAQTEEKRLKHGWILKRYA